MLHVREAALPALGVLDREKENRRRHTAIQQAAEAALRRSSYLAVREVECRYDDGVLTLRGSVPTFFLKQVAQSTVSHRLRNNAVVNNQLKVAPQSSSIPT